MQLDLAVGMGWVQPSSREEVMKKHIADEHTNATAQLQTPSGDDMSHQHHDSSSVRGGEVRQIIVSTNDNLQGSCQCRIKRQEGKVEPKEVREEPSQGAPRRGPVAVSAPTQANR